MPSIIRRAVAQFTGGAFTSVRVDSGPDEPASTRDTIVIRMAADLGDDVLGQALVGSNPGRIYLLVIAPSSCTGYAFHPRALAHEVGQPLTTYPDVAPPDLQLLDAAGLEPRIIVD